jgi:hypothetical protein
MQHFPGRIAAQVGPLVAALVLTACGSTSLASPTPSSSTPTATPTPSSSAPTARPIPTPYPVATLFVSPVYKYSVTLPAGWLVIPAQTAWDGTSAVGHDDPIVDQLIGPQVTGRCKTVFLCGPIAWGLAAPTTSSLADYVKDQDLADARDHPCPPAPESEIAIEIGGEAGALESKHCPAVDGILVLTAVTIHSGVAYSFYLQDPSRDPTLEPGDLSDFMALLGAIQLPS